MKKFYAMLLSVIVAASSMSVSAKKWRIFTDLNVGYGIDYCYEEESYYGFSGMMLLSGGYQLKKCFIGLGTGYVSSFGDFGAVPIYATFRYDFFKNDPKSFSPYVSYSLGYCIATGFCKDGLFVLPSVGLRKGLTETLGLNLGISAGYYGKAEVDGKYEDYEGSDAWGVFFNIGLDF